MIKRSQPAEVTGPPQVVETDANARTDAATNRGAKTLAVAEDAAVVAAIAIAMLTGRNRSSSAEKATSITRTATTTRS
jgi:hypothetical protein